MNIRTKICGLTRVEDAVAAAAAGADAIGVVFAPASPRCVTLDQACAMRDALPPFVSVVALVMDQPRQAVAQIADQLQPDLLQFHGAESPAECAAHGRPFIKAMGMGGLTADAVLDALKPWGAARAVLLDGHRPGAAGGSGERADPALLTQLSGRLRRQNQRWILAGGLSPETVADAIALAGPDAVDVSSGVESRPGIKDHGKITRFIEAAHRARPHPSNNPEV